MADELYVITKSGRGYYRPGATGYTNDVAEAGIWPREQAVKYRDGVEHVTIIPVSELRVEFEMARERLRRDINRIDAALAALVEA